MNSPSATLTLPNGVVGTYAFDNASELTGITYTKSGTTLGNLTYTYDLSGRRTIVGGTYANSGLPSAVSSTGYNANNQMTGFGSASMTYDANGNLTNDGTNSYTWDARNHLVSISGGVSASFQYDPFGRRVSKTVGAMTGYVYDGANVVQELAGGNVSANLLSGGIDEAFTRTDASGTGNFLTDALGSTVALVNSSGTAIASYSYEPFGKTTVTGSSTNSYEYTGRENDGTGLYYYRARYYSPTLQRFISEDPLGLVSGDINFYEYVHDEPTVDVDPTGTCAGALAIACAGGAAGAGTSAAGVLSATGVGALVVVDSYLLNHDLVIGKQLIVAEWVSCDWCQSITRFDPANPPDTFPDVFDPPADWVPHPQGGPDRYLDPDGWTWRWHPDGNPVHPGDHWDLGGPRGPNGESGKKWWWPEGGQPRPKAILPGSSSSVPNTSGRKSSN